ncbi:serine/threonine protein kinase [Kitasatospora sp. NA04385]|uniref:serine/threonine-protein kinase n=1 Tax=Kitasatospora sp. NA04385 TaxID=2742135 RepID=UPI0015909B34|nr:serine/threonine-protein kinase [Kitasatospora sp. NA04385]QKW23424.1 serine/threonine protein kinase [Kitasatospora sp. NA04385]
MAAARMLAARYRLDEPIGRGGMGEVWHGWDVALERRVAVKLLHPDPYQPRGTELFLNEARLAARLTHSGIVTVHDLGQEPDGTAYLVMELLTGTDLADRLRAQGPPQVVEAVDWTLQLCDALAFAHAERVVHRDLKPANLFLAWNGKLKILDFGIAKYREGHSASHSQVMGSVAYMPPERFHGRSGDHRSDLYALGCVLFEFLTGRPPFGIGNPVQLMLRHVSEPARPPGPEAPRPLPPELDRLVLDLLAKEPDDRPRSAAEVIERIRHLPAETSGLTHRWVEESGTIRLRPLVIPPTAVTVPLPAPAPAPTAQATTPSPSPSPTPTEQATATAPVPAPTLRADTTAATVPATAVATAPLPPQPEAQPQPHPQPQPHQPADTVPGPGLHAEESVYVDWIRTLHAVGQLPPPERMLARYGRGYQSNAWAVAVARAWPAAGLGALLATYENARLPRLANEIVRSIPAHRESSEIPAVLAGLRDAGQHLRITVLAAAIEAGGGTVQEPSASVAPIRLAPSAVPISAARAALFAQFAHRVRAVVARRSAPVPERRGAPPFAAVAGAVAAVTWAGSADESSFLDWIRSQPSDEGRFRAEWLPTLHQVQHQGISPDDLLSAVARAWPAAELGAVVKSFHTAGQFQVADRLVCLAPAARTPPEFPALAAGFRQAGQHGRLEVLLWEAGQLPQAFVASVATALLSVGDSDAAGAVLRPRPMNLAQRRNLLLNRVPLR